MAVVTVASAARNSYYSTGKVGWSAGATVSYNTYLQQLYGATGYTFGRSAAFLWRAQSFTTVGALSVSAIRVAIAKIGVPTDNVSLELYSDTGANLPNALLATAENVYTGASINSSFSWLEFNFTTPVALNASTKYWIVLRRSGAVDGTNYYAVNSQNTSVYSGGGVSDWGGSVWTAESATVDFAFQIMQSTPVALYTVTQDTGASPKIHVWRTTNGGLTWTEQDSVNAVAVNDGTKPFAVSDTRSGPYLGIAYFSATNTVRVRVFNMSTNLWATADLGSANATADASFGRNIRVSIDSAFFTNDIGNTVVFYTSFADDADLSTVRKTTTGAWAAAVLLLSLTSAEASLVSDVVTDKWPRGHQSQIYYDCLNDDFLLKTLLGGLQNSTAVALDATAATIDTSHACATYQIYQSATFKDTIIAAYIDSDNTIEERIVTLEQGIPTAATQAAVGTATTTAGRQLSTCRYGTTNYIFANVSGTGIDYYTSTVAGTWSVATNWKTGLTASTLSQAISVPNVGIMVVYTDNGDVKTDWAVGGPISSAGGTGNTRWTSASLLQPKIGVYENNFSPGYSVIGGTSTSAARAQSFTVLKSGSLEAVSLSWWQYGTPTDDHYIDIRPDDGSGKPNQSISLASITFTPSPGHGTQAHRIFRFASPVFLNSGTKYFLCVSRASAADTVNFVGIYTAAAALYPNHSGSTYNGSTGVWGAGDASDLSFVLYFDVPQMPFYRVTQDTKLRVLKSDDGITWTEQDAANAPTVFDSSYPFAAEALTGTLFTAYFTAANTLNARAFNCFSNTWAAATHGTGDATTDASPNGNIGLSWYCNRASVYYVSNADDADIVRASTTGGAWGQSLYINLTSALRSTLKSVRSSSFGTMWPVWTTSAQTLMYYSNAGSDGATLTIDATATTDDTKPVVVAPAPILEDEQLHFQYAYIESDNTLWQAYIESTAAGTQTIQSQSQLSASTTYAGGHTASCGIGSQRYIFASTATEIHYWHFNGASWSSAQTWKTGLTNAAVVGVVGGPQGSLVVAYMSGGDSKAEKFFDIIQKTIPTTANISIVAAFSRTVPTSAAISLSSDYSIAILADSPVGYWRLGEDAGTAAVDSSGNGRHGTTSGATLNQAGALIADSNTSYLFDGIDDKVDVAYNAALNPTGDCSFECWAMCTGGSGSYRSPLTSRDDAPSRGYIFYAASNNKWEAWFGDPVNTWRGQNGGGPDVVLNQWAHLVGVREGTVGKLYVNGRLQYTTAAFTFAANTARPLRFGAGATEGAGSFWFPGKIDDVAFYNVALSAATIANHYAIGAGVRTVSSSVAIRETLSRTATPASAAIRETLSRTVSTSAAIRETLSRTVTSTRAVIQVTPNFTNWSFEEDFKDFPLSQSLPGLTANATIVADATHGSKAVKVEATANNSTSAKDHLLWSAYTEDAFIPVLSSTTYTLRWDNKASVTSANVGTTFVISTYDSAYNTDGWQGDLEEETYNLPTTYTENSFTFTTASNVVWIEILPRFSYLNQATGSIWLDNLRLGTSKTVSSSAAVSTTEERTVSSTATIQTTEERTTPTSVALLTTETRTVSTSAVIESPAPTVPTSGVIQETFAKTAPTSAVISTENQNPVPTSASIREAVAKTVPTSAAILEVGARTVSSSAVVRTTEGRTVSSSAAIRETFSKTVPSSAVVSTPGLSRTTPTSAVVLETFSRTTPSSAAISTPGLSRTILSSAAIQETFERTVTSSAAVVETLSRTTSTSAVVSTPGLTRTVTASGAISETLDRTTSATAAILETPDRTILASAAILEAFERTASTSAAVLETFGHTTPASAVVSETYFNTAVISETIEKTVAATAAISSEDVTFSRTVPASAAIANVFEKTIPASAAVLEISSRTALTSVAISEALSRPIPTTASISTPGLSRTVSTSAAVLETSSRTTTATATVLTTEGRTVLTSAIVADVFSRAASSSAAIQETTARTASATAVIADVFTRTTPTSAAIKEEVAKTVPTSVAMLETLARTTLTSAVLRETPSRTVSTTAAINETLTRTVSSTAVVRTTEARTVAVTVAVRETLSRTLLTSAAIRETFSRTVSTSATIRETLSRTVSTSASIRTTDSRTTLTSAVVSTTEARTASATAIIANVFSRTVPASAALRETLSRTVSTSSVIAYVFTATAPASAAIQETLSRTATATAAILEKISQTTPASAVVTTVEERTAPASAAVTTEITTAVDTSAVVSTQNENLVPTSGVILIEASRALLSSAVVLETLGRTTTASATILEVGESTAPSAAAILEELERTTPLSAAILEVFDRTVLSSAAIQTTQEVTTPASGVVSAVEERTILASAAVEFATTNVMPVFAVITATEVHTVTSTAAIADVFTRTISASAAIYETFEQMAPASAAVAYTFSNTVSTDAVVLEERAHTLAATAVILTETQNSVPSGAAVLEELTRTVSVSAAIQETQKRTLPSEASIQTTNQNTVLASAYVFETTALVAPASVAIQEQTETLAPATAAVLTENETQAPTSVVIQETQERAVAAESVIQTEEQRTLSTTAAIREEISVAVATTSAAVSETFSATVLASSVVSIVKDIFVPTSAIIAEDATNVVSTAAVITATETTTAPASVAVLETLARTVSTTANVVDVFILNAPTEAVILTTENKTAAASSAITTQEQTTVPTTTAIAEGIIRTVPLSVAVKETLQAVAPTSVAIQETFSRVVSSTATIQAQVERILPASGVVREEKQHTIPVSLVVSEAYERPLSTQAVIYAEGQRTISTSGSIQTMESLRYKRVKVTSEFGLSVVKFVLHKDLSDTTEISLQVGISIAPYVLHKDPPMGMVDMQARIHMSVVPHILTDME